MERLIIPTPIKDIDKILRVIHDDAVRGMISYDLIKERSGISNDEETKRYLRKLIESGYIDKNQNGSYSILHDGVVHFSQEGFEGEMIRNDIMKRQQIEIEDLQKRLNEAQLNDIPINNADRKTNITWQIIAGVSTTVVFLLKLFGVEGWL